MALPEPLDSRILKTELELPAGDYVSEDDDSDDSGPEFIEDTSSLPNRQTIQLSVRATYTNWNPQEAFRELVQNWRDGIITSFHLTEKQFAVECERKIANGKTEIIFKVPRPNSNPKEYLGFIHFKPQRDGGIVEITNRNATLQPWHLDMGGTSKSGAGHLAGAHGEGLKVALLVLMRGSQNHKIRCRSGGFTWTFNFTKKGRLVARLNRMSDEAIRRLESQTQTKMGKTLLPFSPSVKRDVQFLLGEPHHGRSENGIPTRRLLVGLADFEAWTEAALFLQNPSPDELVRTRSGDLLIGQRFRERLYLKGLLLAKDVGGGRWASVTNKPLRYGYNIAAGTTNRERQSVAGAYAESATILDIWSEALVSKPELASELSFMLNSTETKYADVDGAKTCIGRKTAQALWSYLRGEPYQRKWYYSPQEKSDCPRLNSILRGLGYEGSELNQLYWDILRDHNLVQTADEEQRKRFSLASPLRTLAGLPKQASDLLRAVVRACELTEGTRIQFVRAGALDLQSLYVEQKKSFIIHERSVSQEGVVEALGLPNNLRTTDIVYHAAIELFTDLLAQLPTDLFSKEQSAKSIEWQRKVHVRLAEQRYFELARLKNIKISTSNSGRLIYTEWVPDRWAPGTAIEIQYHSVSCGLDLQKSVLVAADAISSTMACLCAADALPAIAGVAESGTRQPTCRVLRTVTSETNHHAMNVEEGQDYILLVLLPTDAQSLVSWRTGPFEERHRPIPNNAVAATRSAISHVTSEAVESNNIIGYTPLSLSLYATLAGHNNPSTAWFSTADTSRALDETVQSMLAEPHSDGDIDCWISPVAKYELGRRLTEFNLLDIIEWHEGVNMSASGSRAVIGLLQQGVDGPTDRKRKHSALSGEQARSSGPRTTTTVPFINGT